MRHCFVLALLLIASTTFAQKDIVIMEGASAFSTGSQNALYFTIYNGDIKAITSAWVKELKGWKGKVRSKGEIFVDDCKVKSMGDNTFDAYSKVESVLGEGIRVWVAFDLGGAYLSSAAHPDRYQAARLLLYSFAVDQTKEVVKAEIGVAQKLLSDREAELNALVKNQQKLESDIASFEKQIEAAKGGIVTLKGSQASKQFEIDAQKTVVKGLDDKLKAVK